MELFPCAILGNFLGQLGVLGKLVWKFLWRLWKVNFDLIKYRLIVKDNINIIKSNWLNRKWLNGCYGFSIASTVKEDCRIFTVLLNTEQVIFNVYTFVFVAFLETWIFFFIYPKEAF